MTFEWIKNDIENYGLSQYFEKDGNLISVFEHWDGTYDVIISNGGASLRTSNIIARHENCDVQDTEHFPVVGWIDFDRMVIDGIIQAINKED